MDQLTGLESEGVSSLLLTVLIPSIHLKQDRHPLTL